MTESLDSTLEAGALPETLSTTSESCGGLCAVLGSAPGSAATGPVSIEAQRRWAARAVGERLQVVRRARHLLARHAEGIAAAFSPALQRSQADSLVTEILPLLDAMRFLERRAARLLAPRRLGRGGRPVWLAGVQAEVQRVPLEHVLVIAPANFSLFLPGVQAVQALVAGNAVTWKPGEGGRHVAHILAHALQAAGLPRGVLAVTEEGVKAGQQALARGADKVVFTGSAESGRKILRTLAETATPAVMELSGADAVVVLPAADLALAAKAIAFGLRLNGAEVCMSPRRLVATRETLEALRPLLRAELEAVPPVALKARTAEQLGLLLEEAKQAGAAIDGVFEPAAQRPLLVEGATPAMRVTTADVFAPVLSVIEAPSVLHLPELVNACPYALTAAVFGPVREARAVGEQLRVGTVLINDLIAPTADPRVPFSGRGQSGYGATRGAEGLLEMTATRTMLVRRRSLARHYAPVGEREAPLFAGMIEFLHGGGFGARFRALQRLVAAGRGR